MALFTVNMNSQYLRGGTQVNIVMPDRPMATEAEDFYRSGKKYKVLWLLHGGQGDASDWVRKSMIELYACENDLVVVMPSALNSNYTAWPNFGNGYDMYGFFLKELMPMVYGWLPVSEAREDNYIAGLSMGGNGTLKFALNAPERFCAAAVLSSSPYNYESDSGAPSPFPHVQNNIVNHGGLENLLASNDNIWDAVKDSVGKDLPRFYFTIGNDDPGLGRFLRFKAYAEEIGFPAEFEFIDGYAHEWRFWDLTVQRALEKFGFTVRHMGDVF